MEDMSLGWRDAILISTTSSGLLAWTSIFVKGEVSRPSHGSSILDDLIP